MSKDFFEVLCAKNEMRQRSGLNRKLMPFFFNFKKQSSGIIFRQNNYVRQKKADATTITSDDVSKRFAGCITTSNANPNLRLWKSNSFSVLCSANLLSTAFIMSLSSG
jgi:hypothetical protein